MLKGSYWVTRTTIGVFPSQLVETYGWSGLVESPHGDLEAGSLSDEDVLLGYPHVFKGDAPGVRAPLTHVQLLHRYRGRHQGEEGGLT